MDVNYNVYYPPSYFTEPNSSFPVLYLLHGFYGNYNDWPNHGMEAVTDLEIEDGRITEMIIIMPDGMDAFYCNNYDDRNLLYEDFMVEELISHVDNEYRTIPDGMHRAIAGLSMGGYGSTLHGFKYDTVYSSVYAMSGAFDAGCLSLYDIVNSKPVSILPAFTMEVGVSDRLVYASNRAFRDFLQGKGFEFEYIERSGTHDWTFWMECLPKALRFASENFGSTTEPDAVIDINIADIKIYPNPATHTLTVNTGSGRTARLLSVTGVLIDSKEIKNCTAEIDVHKLPKGMYLILVESEYGSDVNKKIVQ
jgi:enterochelin esterase-like enzyme